nr:low temperature requirement protein A [Micromonospora purpureochromogenes]
MNGTVPRGHSAGQRHPPYPGSLGRSSSRRVPRAGVLWTLALVLDYTGLILGWPVPGLGRTRIEDWKLAGEHLAERYQQFVVIALGETILLTGLTFAGQFTPDRVVPSVVSFATTILMWRIYFHRAGTVLPAAIEAIPSPARLGRAEFHTHLLIVTGILATGVGHALVIHHSVLHGDPLWLTVILGGPALFLAGRSRLEHEVFARVSASRVIGLLALASLAPVMVRLPPLIATSTAATVLAGP